MGLLQQLDDAPGHLKATLQGQQGSGKTLTAVNIAKVLHKYFNSQRPVAFFDTEKGSDYIAAHLEEGTGHKPLRVKTRAFSDLIEVVNECVAGASDILIVDSITHVWRELQDAYMKALNSNRRFAKARMDIQDIMQIKKQWEPWPDLFLNSNLHILVCGREGNEWGHEENEETGKKDLVTTGKKMKVEGEFGYEASLMISMKAQQIQDAIVKHKGGARERRPRQILNVATVLKDRFDMMNGQEFEMPTGEEFLPFIEKLRPNAERPIDMSVKSHQQIDHNGDDAFRREKRDREILLEEIQGEMTRVYPGTSAKEKAAKLELIERAFETRSWTRIEGYGPERLRQGLAFIRDALKAIKPDEAKPADQDSASN